MDVADIDCFFLKFFTLGWVYGQAAGDEKYKEVLTVRFPPIPVCTHRTLHLPGLEAEMLLKFVS